MNKPSKIIRTHPTQEIYQNLKEGKDPFTGQQLVKAGPNGKHRNGVDISLNPHKSYSAAYASAVAIGDTKLANDILDTIKAANQKLCDYIENNLIQTRDSQGNSTPSGNAIIMSTFHFTNRENKINLGFHNVFFNITQDKKGNYRAINTDALYQKEHLIAVGEKFLAEETQRRGLATELEKHPTGKSFYTKLSGVTEKECGVPSTRSKQIDEYIEKNREELTQKYPNASEGKLRELACITTRKDKEEITLNEVVKDYVDNAKEQGCRSPQECVNAIKEAGNYNENQMTATQVVKSAADILTQFKSVFIKQKLLTISARLSLNNPSVTFKGIQSSVVKLTASKEFLHLKTVSMKGKGKVEYMTTQVAAKQPFNYSHSLNTFDSTKLAETRRFNNEQTKGVTKGLADKDIDKVFSIIEKSNQVHEIKDRNKLIKAITKDYTSRDIKNTVVIASTNHDRKDINNSIRTELKEQGKIEKEGKVYITRETISLAPADKHFAQNYSTGNSLFASKSAPGFKPGQEATITYVDTKKNTLTVEKNNGSEVEINLTKDGSKFSGYRETETEFVKGDRALFTKNDKQVGVKNGTTGTVVKVENDYLKVKLDNNKIAAFDIKDYSYLTHANCITNHKMQGATTKESIIYLDSKNAQMNNYQAANVALTRAEEKVTVYTDNIEKIKEQIKTEQIKMK